ncbi:M14 family zinc carboxypeptidase [Egicoccus sp. AB-alg2]|uniref:M14 family zinc carboxypeptidase n=1 Tax=Egicoccus sp. AB-alg2 TaxID=3242693 RepID=UPI00359CDBB3
MTNTTRRRRLTALLGAACLVLAIPLSAAADPVSKPGGPFVPPAEGDPNRAAILSADDVERELLALERRSKGAMQLDVVGQSGEGRPLYMATIGTGDERVWVQGRIHGNEPYGPDAALAFLKTLVAGGQHASQVLSEVTFAVIPMYNPDGSEAYIRQDTVHRIDLNRDWGVDQDIFDQLNAVRVQRGQNPLPQSTFDNYTQLRAVESQAFWYAFAEFRPHYMVDIHHQGTYYAGDTDDMTTFSVGISLDELMLSSDQWDTVRRMGVLAADAAGRHGAVTPTRYPYINIPEGVVSAAMLNGPGPEGEYADWTPRGAMFFESRGGIGQKSRGYLVKQNVDALWAIVDAVADGSIDTVDADRWDDILPRGGFLSNQAKFGY